jgi:hypothetical protein
MDVDGHISDAAYSEDRTTAEKHSTSKYVPTISFGLL